MLTKLTTPQFAVDVSFWDVSWSPVFEYDWAPLERHAH